MGETLVELGAVNEQIVVLDADVSSSTQTRLFAEHYPERFFNFGIAEANMVSAAAGLATCGYIPFVSTFALFLAMRAGDQVRAQVAYPSLNVKLVGGYAGLSDYADGASHQSVEDIAVMRAIPNMTVICPSDLTETRWRCAPRRNISVPYTCAFPARRYGTSMAPEHPFEIGKGIVLREGSDVMLIATGTAVSLACRAAELAARRGFPCA